MDSTSFSPAVDQFTSTAVNGSGPNFGLPFGAYMRQVRKDARLSARFVASSLGVSAQYICDMERERRMPPDRAMVQRWSEVIGADTNAAELRALADRSGDYRALVEALAVSQIARR